MFSFPAKKTRGIEVLADRGGEVGGGAGRGGGQAEAVWEAEMVGPAEASQRRALEVRSARKKNSRQRRLGRRGWRPRWAGPATGEAAVEEESWRG